MRLSFALLSVLVAFFSSRAAGGAPPAARAVPRDAFSRAARLQGRAGSVLARGLRVRGTGALPTLRDQTHVPCTGRQIPNHRTAREVRNSLLSMLASSYAAVYRHWR